MRKYHLQFLCVLLIALGTGLFCYKYFYLNYPLSANIRTDAWIVEAHASFLARNKPLKLNVFVPKSTDQFIIMDESFISRGFGLTTQFKDGNRQAVWSIRKATGQQGLYYRALVRRGGATPTTDKSKPPPLAPSEFEGAKLEAAKSMIAEIRERTADTEGFVSALLMQINTPGEDSNVKLLLGRNPDNDRRVDIATRVLAEAGVSARKAYGILLEDQVKNTSFIQRLEVYDGGIWKSFDLVTASTTIPDNYMSWWRGDEPFLELSGGERLKAVVSVVKHHESGVSSAISGVEVMNPSIVRFSLFSLPLEAQSVYRVILMIPIGAFIVVVLRNVVGLKTFGTFMPVLIALAFRETELLWGIIFFSLLTGVGLIVRFYLEHLKLILVPRLAAVLIVVILLMAALSVVTHILGLERGLSVALFPMVILTMTIERMSIIWDELGPYDAFKQGLASFFVATVIYGVISNKSVGHIIFVFPELLLIILAMTIMLGRYTGYRLLELRRFKALAE